MSTSSAPEAAGLAPDRLDRVYAYLEEVAQSGRVPGAALLVARHGQAVEPRAFGSPTLAGIGGRGPAMQPDNIFLVASVTKPVTVTAAMLLVERGLLYLDERVRDTPTSPPRPAIARPGGWAGDCTGGGIPAPAGPILAT